MLRLFSGLRSHGPTRRMTSAKSGSTFFRCRMASRCPRPGAGLGWINRLRPLLRFDEIVPTNPVSDQPDLVICQDFLLTEGRHAVVVLGVKFLVLRVFHEVDDPLARAVAGEVRAVDIGVGLLKRVAVDTGDIVDQVVDASLDFLGVGLVLLGL